MIDPLVLIPIGLSILSNMVAAAAWLYGWQSKKHTAQQRDVKALELRVHAADLELSIVRERLQHIPNIGQFHELAGALGELKGDHKALYSTVRGMGDQISTIGATITRIDDYLRDKTK